MQILTVSRLVGSYGDEIAAKVAERMGLEFVGRNGLHELAITCDPEYSDACGLYETEHGPGFFERLFFDRPSYKSLFEALTFEQASRGNVVIVGRGAQVVLHDQPGVFCVHVVAPRDIRIERVEKRLACPREEAEHYLDKYDGERANVIKAVFGRDPNDWSLYDLVFNTAHFTPDSATDVVLQAMTGMIRVPDQEGVGERFKRLGVAKRIETLVRKKLTSAVARNVEIVPEPGGVMRLTGRIREKADKERVEKIATEYPGVTKVENDLMVTEITFGV
ncbi:MAG: cytidylate kinase family protein [Pseudomonadota bacterium]